MGTTLITALDVDTQDGAGCGGSIVQAANGSGANNYPARRGSRTGLEGRGKKSSLTEYRHPEHGRKGGSLPPIGRICAMCTPQAAKRSRMAPPRGRWHAGHRSNSAHKHGPELNAIGITATPAEASLHWRV